MFAANLKSLRKENGFSQEALAEKMGVSRQAITKWETGAGVPDISNLIAVSQLFGVTLDELVGNEVKAPAAAYAFQSLTCCDVEGPKSFDINLEGAAEVCVQGVEGEKLEVLLASDVLENLQKDFKVKIDAGGRNYDIDVTRVGDMTETAAKESLIVIIKLPQTLVSKVELNTNARQVSFENIDAEDIEYSGNVQLVKINNVGGHVEIDSSSDLTIECATLPQRLDINQLKATSKLVVPADATFATRTRGLGNRIIMDGLEATDGCETQIELNGMKSELTITR